MVTIIILGPQASGKGTQAQLLAEKLRLPVFSSGVLAKKARDRKDSLGKKARFYYDQGKLFPLNLLMPLVKDKIKKINYQKGIIIEGIPRNLAQVKELNKLLLELVLPQPWVIYLKIDQETVYQRIKNRRVCEKCNLPYISSNWNYQAGICSKCGGKLVVRPDDKPLAIKKRLKVYFHQTEPLIDYYRKRGRLIEIDGEPSIAKVFQSIISRLQERGVVK